MDSDMTNIADIRKAYSEKVSEIEQQFAADYTEIDGSYSRATQYAGLVRNELINAATERRAKAHEMAAQEHEAQINAVATPTESEGVADGNGNEKATVSEGSPGHLDTP